MLGPTAGATSSLAFMPKGQYLEGEEGLDQTKQDGKGRRDKGLQLPQSLYIDYNGVHLEKLGLQQAPLQIVQCSTNQLGP